MTGTVNCCSEQQISMEASYEAILEIPNTTVVMFEEDEFVNAYGKDADYMREFVKRYNKK